MISEASCSTTPAPLRSSPDPTQLAPGFRFHPTDEELVGYYLKRKVTGRPIHIDAIAEVDIYGTEPWDLPSQSRLRSRDLEWYFFTSLGRKYSNRCRTNRATLEGYWKTTGKDRSVQGRTCIIGMKKTLVFHIGRAPSGQRTNWVMHEYRLQDESLSRSGVQQDGYVVCKIFEKIGAGPQNGAQYGAPFIEEEWDRDEDEDAKAVLVKEGGDNEHLDAAVRDFVQLGDFLLDQDSGIPHVDALSHPATSNDEDHDCEAEDPSNFLVESLEEQGSDNDMHPNIDIPSMRESITSLSRFGKQKVLENQSNSASIQNNGFVQLKDIVDEENTSSILNVESADCFMERCNNNSHMEQVGNSEILLQDATFIDQSGQLCMCHDIRHDYCLQMDSLDNMPSQHSSGQLADVNLMYYDAVSHEVPSLEDVLKNDTSLASVADFGYLDELIAYYDATDDNINYPPADFFLPLHESSASSMVGASSSSSKEGHVQQNLEAYESLQRAPLSNYDPLSGGNGNLIADPKLKDHENNTLTKRLATLLNAITAPPAFAGEASVMGKIVEKTSSSSTDTVRITAGMIRLQSLMPLMADTESWKLQKQTEMNLLLSYGISKSFGSEKKKKVHGGFISTVCWVGFHLFFIGSFVLALSYKLGVCVCNL